MRQDDVGIDAKMIPLKDDNSTQIFPFVTIGIIFANLLVFLYEINPWFAFERKIFLFGAVPYNITHLDNFLAPVTLFTSLFFHGDFMHLLGNMLYLWVFGDNIEDSLGHARFLLFYFLCGVAASLGFILTIPNSHLPLIGASGAISGILGAYFLLYPNAKVLVLVPFLIFWKKIRLAAFWFLLFWIALQFLYGSTAFTYQPEEAAGEIAWFAHILGFIAGAVLLKLFLRKDAEISS